MSKKKGIIGGKSSSASSISLPLNILRDRSVAVLESIVEYLKDKKGLTYHEIALLLNRNDRTIWTVYSRVKKKRDARGGKNEN